MYKIQKIYKYTAVNDLKSMYLDLLESTVVHTWKLMKEEDSINLVKALYHFRMENMLNNEAKQLIK